MNPRLRIRQRRTGTDCKTQPLQNAAATAKRRRDISQRGPATSMGRQHWSRVKLTELAITNALKTLKQKSALWSPNYSGYGCICVAKHVDVKCVRTSCFCVCVGDLVSWLISALTQLWRWKQPKSKGLAHECSKISGAPLMTLQCTIHAS